MTLKKLKPKGKEAAEMKNKFKSAVIINIFVIAVCAILIVLSVFPLSAQPSSAIASPTYTATEIIASKNHQIYAPANTPAHDASTQTGIYVDYENGDDTNDASFSSPVKTLAKAKELAYTAAKSFDGEIIVFLMEGTHVLTETLTLEPLKERADNSITFRSMPGGRAVISGGTEISGWSLHDSEKNIWKAPAEGIDTRDLYVNGEPAKRAASSENEYSGLITAEGITIDGTEAAGLRNQDKVEYVFRTGFTEPRIHGQSAKVFEGKSVITFNPETWALAERTKRLSLGDDLANLKLAYIENAYELLDAEGEWYLDTGEDAFYYKPRNGENMNDVKAYAGNLETLIELKGYSTSQIEDISFQGLTFAHTTWLQPNEDTGYISTQAGFYRNLQMTNTTAFVERLWMRPSAAIESCYSSNVNFYDNDFVLLGGVAVSMAEGTQDTDITGNYFAKSGGSAIILGGFGNNDTTERADKRITRNILIQNNLIHGVAATYRDMCGMTIGYTQYTTVANNLIYDLPYTGVSIGWGWGKKAPVVKGNRVTQNHIHHVMQVLMDGGAVYCLGYQPLTSIDNNYAHNLPMVSSALYLDDGSLDVDMYNNVAHDNHNNYSAKGSGHMITGNYFDKIALLNNFDGRMLSVFSQYKDMPPMIFKDNTEFSLSNMPEEAIKIIENAGIQMQYYQRFGW